MALILKEHVKAGVLTVSLCDSDLVGKTFEEGNLFLDLSTSYYKGEVVNFDKAVEMLTRARSATVVGKESVEVAKKVSTDCNVKEISGISFVNIMKF